ncbi:HNH endonuclease signature motif containing protein [Cryobacterium cryoconiti]|uniref:HNH endonuclease n=1 Tax=Cryobacterium cryoconiti TaxID=1259239 RepID=A0A4Y8JRF8_9MICO|nr:HNH endonuclease [Cryobacterium cryoconiti]
MPRAPKKCGQRTCETRVVARPYCPEHTVAWAGSTASSRAPRSKTQRDRILARDPICRCPGCARCTQHGCTQPSTDDDHVLNVGRGGTEDDSNHQGLCSPCHKRKTQLEAQLGKDEKAPF